MAQSILLTPVQAVTLSLGQFVNFMTSSASQQIKIVQDAKYPAERTSRAQARYWQPFRDRIRIYHGQQKQISYLTSEAASLRADASRASTTGRQNKLLANADALDDYAKHFGTRAFVVQQRQRFTLTFHGVTIRVTPDLVVREGKLDKLIRLYPNNPVPSRQYVQIICQTLFEAADQAGWPQGGTMTKARVVLLDVQRGMQHNGAQMGARMKANIAATCQQISLIWNSI